MPVVVEQGILPARGAGSNYHPVSGRRAGQPEEKVVV